MVTTPDDLAEYVGLKNGADAFVVSCLSEAKALVNNAASASPIDYQPVTVPYADGSAITYTRTGDIVTIDVNPGTLAGANRKPIPDGFAPAGNVYGMFVSAASIGSGGAFPAGFYGVQLDEPGISGTLGAALVALAPGPFQPFAAQWLADAGGVVSSVPAAVLDRAYLEAGSELYHRRQAPNGIAQFATPDGNPVRVARDPLVGVYPLITPYLGGGFA